MTTKDKHILTFWYTKLSELNSEQGKPVSAGALAEYVGMARPTAKKYLVRLVGEGVVTTETSLHKNGVDKTTYQVV